MPSFPRTRESSAVDVPTITLDARFRGHDEKLDLSPESNYKFGSFGDEPRQWKVILQELWGYK
jgi:hypothetical protein